jgi:predicted DNA-binding protein YlxM (UPF0122 family)
MDTRLRILKESGIMFSKYGIRSITMDYIANELGISKRTIYEIFKDKEDLVSQAIEEGLKAHKGFCHKIIEESDNVIEAIFKIGKLNTELFGKMNPLFFEDLKKYHSKIYNKINQKGEIKDFKLTYSLLERGVKEKLISKDINIDIVNMIIHKMLDFVHAEELRAFGPNEVVKAALLPYFIGISTDKGRELIENYLKTF